MMPVPLPALPARKHLRPQRSMELPPLRSSRVPDQLRERLRLMHYEMGGPEVEAFLTHLADVRSVVPSTHNQALSALRFFYGKVLGHTLPWLKEIGHPHSHRRLPAVLTVAEVRQVLGRLDGEHGLLARLLYGTGLRLNEALQLRVKDIDFLRADGS
jgi:integrase